MLQLYHTTSMVQLLHEYEAKPSMSVNNDDKKLTQFQGPAEGADYLVK